MIFNLSSDHVGLQEAPFSVYGFFEIEQTVAKLTIRAHIADYLLLLYLLA